MTSQSNSRGVIGVITLLFTALTALYLLIGGAWLLAVGGSAYYVITGVVLLGVTWLLWRRNPAALVLYALVLIGTAIWALFESGPDFWALAPRSGVLVIFGVWLLLLMNSRLVGDRKLGVASLVIALVAWAGVLVYASFNDPQQVNGTLNAAAPTSGNSTGIDAADWPAYGRTQEGTRYSPLQQITPENVKNLQVAWTFRTGDMKGPNDPVEITNEVTPIKIGDLLYLCSPHQILFALDAKTGALKWKFDPQLKADPSFQHVTCRGVSYVDLSASATAVAPAAATVAIATPASDAPAVADASRPAATADCTRRIYLPVNDGHLYALDALTGQRCTGFGHNGDLDLQHAQPVTTPGMYEPTSPSIITSKAIVVAGAVEDNFSSREPSGVIRGFDVRTGELLWAFDPGAKDPNHIPGPGEHYTWTSPNSWAPAAYDAKLDIVYLPMGVTTPDIWGGNRTPEQERYASGLLALHASTGELAWFYQTAHHDLWDMDQPSQPTIADITDKDGNRVPVVYAPAKTGNLFVLDRRTGVPVVPAPETPVPQGAAPGDHVTPTQPFSPHLSSVEKPDRRRYVGRDDVRPACVPGDVPQAALRGHVHAAVAAGHARVPGQPGHVRVGWYRRRHRPPDRGGEPDRVAVRLASDSARPWQPVGAGAGRQGQRHGVGHPAAIRRAVRRHDQCVPLAPGLAVQTAGMGLYLCH
jgi:quinoprotein glucose dehydrogenase